MKTSELRRYKSALEAKRAELAAAIWGREEMAIERAPDVMDNVQLATERELAIRHLCLESGLLRNVSEALARIDDGSYGVCLNCDSQISVSRLQAVPWAGYCVCCQEAVDRGQGIGPVEKGTLRLRAIA